MHRINRDELNAIILQLDQAIRNHEEWFETLNRQIVCHLPYDRRSVRQDAHHECLFGQWLYQYANPHLRQHPAFEAIELEHRRMHHAVAEMLLSIGENGVTQPELYDRFTNSLQRLRLEINTLKRELETIYYNLDGLTGANNRIGMLTHLREQLELLNRGVQQFSITMLDLDHFKQVNDNYGHMTGDRVLVAVTQHILNSIRPYDRLYRYGGEEFLLSMPHTDDTAAMLIVERLREGIQQLTVNSDDDRAVQVTASFGIIEVSSKLSVEEAILRADQALYLAKSLGRNCSQLWSPPAPDTGAPSPTTVS